MTNVEYCRALELIDGMRLTFAGVAGVVRVERRQGMTEFVHHPSATGKRTAAYIAMRRQLGDDYVTDITGREDVMEKVFAKAERLMTV